MLRDRELQHREEACSLKPTQPLSCLQLHSALYHVPCMKEDDILSFENCELYMLKEPTGLNRPFGQPGMFKVGFDLEPGKYNVVPYGNDEEPVVRIHKDSKYDIDSFSDNAFPEKGKIKVKKGDYLELDNCILEKE